MTDTDKLILFNKLNTLFQSLTTEQKQQQLITLHCSEELYNSFSTNVRVEFSSAHMTTFVKSEGEWDLVRQKKQGELMVKPLMLQKYLKQITN